MATYITIQTLNGGAIDIQFNDLKNERKVNLDCMVLMSSKNIFCIYQEITGGLTVYLTNERSFTLCAITELVPGYLPVQSVNGTTPTDNEHLRLLITQL